MFSVRRGIQASSAGNLLQSSRMEEVNPTLFLAMVIFFFLFSSLKRHGVLLVSS